VDLIYDVYLVPARLRGKPHLIYELTDVLYRVIRGGIELMDIKRTIMIERHTGLAFIAGFDPGGDIFAVDSLGQYTCRCGLAHPARPAEKERMGQLSRPDGILQGSRYMLLTHHILKSGRAVFAR